MKRQLIAIVAAVAAMWAATSDAAVYNNLAAFQAATQSLTLIDFDTDTFGNPTVGHTPIGNTYASLGAVFPIANEFENHFIGPVSPPNGWINNSFQGGMPFFDVLFTGGNVTAVGVHNVLFGFPAATLSAFDSSNNFLGSVTSDNNGQTLDFFGLTTTTPIARVEVRFSFASGWGLDDLWFGQAGTATVPEPASMVVWAALGTFGLVVGKRRRKCEG